MIWRLGALLSGLSYLALVPLILGIILHGHAGGMPSPSNLFRGLFGFWIIVPVALLVAGAAFSDLYEGFSATFQRDWSAMTTRQQHWLTTMGRAGYAARGTVFGLIVVFLTHLAFENRASPLTRVAEEWTLLAHQPYGPWVILPVGLGVVAFGIYAALCALVMRTR